jgi:hypothetical protein
MSERKTSGVCRAWQLTAGCCCGMGDMLEGQHSFHVPWSHNKLQHTQQGKTPFLLGSAPVVRHAERKQRVQLVSAPQCLGKGWHWTHFFAGTSSSQ